MHGPSLHDPLRNAAKDSLAVARETKSPTLERVAVFAMIGSAIVGMAVAALHAVHLIKKDLKGDSREKDREHNRLSETPPSQRPDHDDTTRMLDTDGERRWIRREEKTHNAQAYTRHR